MFISDIKASQVHLSWHLGKETYVVTLTGKKDDLAQIELSPSALQSLIFQALAYMPHMEPSIVVKGEADAFRKQDGRHKLFYLPPYSPHLNPDEQISAHVKRKVSRQLGCPRMT